MSFKPLVTSSGAVVTSTENIATSSLDVVMWSVRTLECHLTVELVIGSNLIASRSCKMLHSLVEQKN